VEDESSRRQLLRRIRALPWRHKLRLAARLSRDGRVSWGTKALIPALAAYLAMPLDLIPDFIPVLGQLDDLLIVAAGLWLLLRLIPLSVVEEHLQALEEAQALSAGPHQPGGLRQGGKSGGR